MATATKPAMPADYSDDFGLALYRETSSQVPADERTTCPLHLRWSSDCRHLHGER
jgi:hypothetical protein